MLEQIYNSCYEAASQLKGWQKLDKNEIANLYLDNRHNEKGSVYAAALLCRYWYKVGLIWKNNSNAISQEDCYAIVWDGIERAMDYAPWRNASNSLYQDPNGPDKAINVCIESVRKSLYDYSNRDKRKLNHKSNTVSMDALHEASGDYSAQLLGRYDVVEDKSLTRDLPLILYIRQLTERGKLPEAILIDTICFDDSLTHDGGETYFNTKKFILIVHSLDEAFVEHFSQAYGVNKKAVEDCLLAINGLSKYKIHKLINRTLYLAKKDLGL